MPSLPKPTTRKGWPHHRGLYVQLFSNSGVGSFTSLKNRWMKVLWDGTYRFSSLSEKIRKSNRLQISLQGRHFLSSYLKTPSVGPIGVWTRDLPLSRPALSQLSSPPLAAVTLLLAAVNKNKKIRYPPSKISAKTSKCNKQHFLFLRDIFYYGKCYNKTLPVLVLLWTPYLVAIVTNYTIILERRIWRTIVCKV